MNSGRGRSGAALTLREAEVLALMVSGLTLHRIAAELEVKYGTVSSMVDRIKKKRGAATKLELVTSELRERAIRLAITCDLPSGTKK